jgi:hypothetical protein
VQPVGGVGERAVDVEDDRVCHVLLLEG